jgi:4-hydroxyphenylpyruvate dioxygenase
MSTATPQSQNNPTDLWDNPMGTFGFEFVEYTAEDTAALGRLFEQMGFQAVARHRSKAVTHYRQGEINFIINAEPRSFAQTFARAHGPSVCAIAFRLRDAGLAQARALELGAEAHSVSVGPIATPGWATPGRWNSAPSRTLSRSDRWSSTFRPYAASAAA